MRRLIRSFLPTTGLLFAAALMATATLQSAGAAVNDVDTCRDGSGGLAIEACTRAIASGEFQGRDLAGLYSNRAFEYGQKSDHDRAIADYSAAIRLDPNCAAAFSNRGVSWRRQGQIERAIADYSEAIRLDPKAGYYRNRAIAWRQKDDNDRAIADYSEAIRLDPQDPDLYLNRSITYKARGNFVSSLADLMKAIVLEFQDRS